MAIHDAYEPEGSPIITPGNFFEKLEKIADVAVACFSYKALRHVLDHYEHELYYRFQATANGAMDIYYLPQFGVLFFMSPTGASLAGGLLHLISYFSGVTKFVYFGSCGVLDPSLRGKFIAPISCYREEGYSYHYAPPSKYMPIKNHETVAKFIDSLGYPVVSGKGWTTDAMLNETRAKVAARKEEGVLCVDMEGSGLQAIANHLGLELYLFFFSGDIVQDEWVRGDLGGEEERRRQSSAVEVALELGKSLANAE